MDVLPQWPDWPTSRSLSISYSSAGMFDRCERSWINRYGFPQVGGIIPFAYGAQGKLLPYQALVGTLTDNVIELAIRRRLSGKEWPSGDQMMRGVSFLLQEYITFSHSWRDQIADFGRAEDKYYHEIRLRPVDRIFFNEPFSKDELNGFTASAAACLRKWLDAEFPDELDAIDLEGWWLSKPGMNSAPAWYWLAGHPAYASFDLIVKAKDETIIYDWKTGKVRLADVLTQLHAYAAFAAAYWGDPLDQIRLVPVWLGEESLPVTLYRANESRIKELQQEWTHRIAVLRERIERIRQDRRLWMELFPATTDAWKCKGCQFRACPTYQKVQSLSVTPPPDSEPDWSMYND